MWVIHCILVWLILVDFLPLFSYKLDIEHAVNSRCIGQTPNNMLDQRVCYDRWDVVDLHHEKETRYAYMEGHTQITSLLLHLQLNWNLRQINTFKESSCARKSLCTIDWVYFCWTFFCVWTKLSSGTGSLGTSHLECFTFDFHIFILPNSNFIFFFLSLST